MRVDFRLRLAFGSGMIENSFGLSLLQDFVGGDTLKMYLFVSHIIYVFEVTIMPSNILKLKATLSFFSYLLIIIDVCTS